MGPNVGVILLFGRFFLGSTIRHVSITFGTGLATISGSFCVLCVGENDVVGKYY